MEHKKYLEDISTLPLEELEEKYGEQPVYDNYRILVDLGAESLNKIIQGAEKFEVCKDFNSSSGREHFKYLPGILYVQTVGEVFDNREVGFEDMKKDYKSTILIHPYQEKDMTDITFEEASQYGSEKSCRALARGINDLSKLLEDNNISHCFPSSSKPDFDKKIMGKYSEMAKYIPSKE